MLRLRSDKDIAAPELDDLRTTAQDLAVAEDWAALHALRGDLQRDREFWPDLWGPLAAVAASQVGAPDAFEVLQLAARTDYGALAGHLLRYRVAG
jgi:hypothetical protein